jgi:predicted unusual protein kinase regulating ubiquinone biosynthesis (AarF/ABC1/UbiB family)
VDAFEPAPDALEAGLWRKGLQIARHAFTLSVVVARIVSSYLWVIFRWKILELPIDGKRLGALHRRNARLYREAAVRLKGGMIKVGQFISARVDIMPPEFVEELSLLQDQVEPDPYQVVAPVIRRELGKDPDDVFAEFEREAVAAASFGQVHRALTRDGRRVAVKIQHQLINVTLEIDLFIFRAMVLLLARLLATKLDLTQVYDEVATALRNELRYDKEAEYCEIVRRNFEEDPRIVIPRVLPEHSTRRVLTLEYVDGYKITDVERMRELGLEPGEVLALVIGAYCKQIYVDGFFQSDPHPGNLFFMAGPRVGIVDFGQSKWIPREVHEGLRRGAFAAVTHDHAGLVDALIELGLIKARDRHLFLDVVQKVAAKLPTGSPAEVNRLDFEEMRDWVMALLSKIEGVQIPNDLVLYGRTISLLHGLATRLDPEINVFRVAAPYLIQFLLGASPSSQPASERS